MAESKNATARKHYVRVITDKRRQQNRTSQKKYRERLRKRLEELEEHVASTTADSKADDTSVPTRRPPIARMNSRTDSANCQPGHQIVVTQRPPGPRKNSDIDFGDVFQAAGDLALPRGFMSPAHTFQVSFVTNHNTPFHMPSIDSSGDAQSAAADAATSLPIALDLMPKPDSDSLDMREFWPVPVEAYQTPYTPPPHLSQSVPTRAYSIFPSRLPVSLYHHSDLGTSQNTSPSNLPNPYLNHLSLNGEAWMGASLAIAASLGISRSAYVNDHPSLFYHSTERNFYHLPKTLRPTSAQLTLPHPVYLDCIIFPAFRTRAIIKSARGELDHGALFMDLINDGLVCWGNSEATAGNGRGMRDGVAWSARSWEARCWFLKRWESLVGKDKDNDEEEIDELLDEDGIWENSRWWWTLRGDIMW